MQIDAGIRINLQELMCKCEKMNEEVQKNAKILLHAKAMNDIMNPLSKNECSAFMNAISHSEASECCK